MKKRILSALLATSMLLTIVGCGSSKENTAAGSSAPAASSSSAPAASSAATGNQDSSAEDDSAYPEYLNLDGYFPIVKDGYDVTLKVVVIDNNNMLAYDKSESYYAQMAEQLMNVKLDITQVSSEGAAEYINMLFASDNLPDLLLTEKALTTEQLVTYGVQEGQLLNFAPYMNDATLMPGFNAVCEAEPALKANLTASDGGIYTQVLVADSDAVGSFQRRTVNVDMLTEAGVEMPTTLDEFVDAMYAVKAKFPDSIPLGGTYEANSVHGIILNALGFNDSAENTNLGLYNVGVRNNEPGVPAADKEIYGEFLNIMKKFFDDGIISRDYFTMDVDTNKLNAKSGLYSVWTGWVDPSDFDNVPKYNMLPALKSSYSEEAFVGHPSLYTIGKVVASAKTEYPEVIARFCDYVYTDEGNFVYQFSYFTSEQHKHLAIDGWGGVNFTSTGLLNYVDCLPPEGKDYDTTHTNYGQWAPAYPYAIMLSSQGMGSKTGQIPYRMIANGWDEIKTDYDNWKATENTANSFWRCDTYDTYMPTREYGLPILYFGVEDAARINELKSVIQPHMETETIKFITGERSLDELDAYFDELDALGYQEYIAFYQTAYQSFLDNQ